MAAGCVSPSSFPLLELDARVKLEQIGRERISNTVRYEIASPWAQIPPNSGVPSAVEAIRAFIEVTAPKK